MNLYSVGRIYEEIQKHGQKVLTVFHSTFSRENLLRKAPTWAFMEIFVINHSSNPGQIKSKIKPKFLRSDFKGGRWPRNPLEKLFQGKKIFHPL